MAAKTTKAPAKAGKAAPAADQKDGASAPLTDTKDSAGIAPAAGAVNEQSTGNGDGAANNEGPTEPDGDGADTGNGAGPTDLASGQPDPAADAGAPPAGDSPVSGESVNALTSESANALTGEGANDGELTAPPAGSTDGDELGDLETSDTQETTQTPPENSPIEPVVLGLWALPKITQFPATLTLTNNTASRFVVQGKGIPVDRSIVIEVTEQQFLKLAKSLVSHVRLDKWDDVRGLQVAHESND